MNQEDRTYTIIEVEKKYYHIIAGSPSEAMQKLHFYPRNPDRVAKYTHVVKGLKE